MCVIQNGKQNSPADSLLSMTTRKLVTDCWVSLPKHIHKNYKL